MVLVGRFKPRSKIKMGNIIGSFIANYVGSIEFKLTET
jgi:hypothetical protein